MTDNIRTHGISYLSVRIRNTVTNLIYLTDVTYLSSNHITFWISGRRFYFTAAEFRKLYRFVIPCKLIPNH